MADSAPRHDSTACIYCGGTLTGVSEGEHVIQAALGGRVTIQTVCGKCNGLFSALDKELVSRSFMAAVASQEVDSRIWQVWDVDHAAGNLLIEARPDWKLSRMHTYPQIVFDPKGIQTRCGLDEAAKFGQRDAMRIIERSVLRARCELIAGNRRAMHFERINFSEENAFDRQYRFPPRAYFPHSLQVLADRLQKRKLASCTVRFATQRGMRTALNALQYWNRDMSIQSVSERQSSRLPAFRFIFDTGMVLRSLVKVGVNLIAYCCPNTPVNPATFQLATNLVRGEIPVAPEDLKLHGFVNINGVKSIASEGAHCFRLFHSSRGWMVIGAFFGGKIGTVVRFPGPNFERWSVLDVTAPINSKTWTLSPSNLSIPGHLKVCWTSADEIMPSAGIIQGGEVQQFAVRSRS